MPEDQVQVQLGANITKFLAGLGEAGTAVKGFAAEVESALGPLGATVAGMTSAFAGMFAATKIVTFFKDTATEAWQVQRALVGLNATLTELGISVSDATPRLEELFTDIRNLSGASEKEMVPAFQKLVGITQDFEAATEAMTLAADLSRQGFGSVGETANDLAMILQGRLAMAARNLGVGMVDAAGRTRTAADVLLVLEQRADLAAAQVDGTTDVILTAKTAWTAFSEAIGKTSNELLTSLPVFGQLLKLKEWAWDAFGTATMGANQFKGALVDAAEHLKQTPEELKKASEAIKKYQEDVDRFSSASLKHGSAEWAKAEYEALTHWYAREREAAKENVDVLLALDADHSARAEAIVRATEEYRDAQQKKASEERLKAGRKAAKDAEELAAGLAEVDRVGREEDARNAQEWSAGYDKIAAEFVAREQKEIADRARYYTTLEDMESEHVKALEKEGLLSPEAAATRQDAIEAAKLAIIRKSYDEQLKLDNLSLKERERIEAEKTQTVAQETKKQQEIQDHAAILTTEHVRKAFAPLQSALSRSLTSMLEGTKNFGDGLRDLFRGVLDGVVQMLADMAAKWVVDQLVAQVSTKTAATAQVPAAAAVAAVNAMASVAAIPYYGWAMAPGVGADTFEAGMSYMSAIAAAGGYDVPGAVNPMAQLHAREMVLPAHLADRIRDMSEPSSRTDITLHWNITAMDGQDVLRTLNNNQDALQRVLGEMVRNGRIGR